jgi:hypothetical protein
VDVIEVSKGVPLRQTAVPDSPAVALKRLGESAWDPSRANRTLCKQSVRTRIRNDPTRKSKAAPPKGGPSSLLGKVKF